MTSNKWRFAVIATQTEAAQQIKKRKKRARSQSEAAKQKRTDDRKRRRQRSTAAAATCLRCRRIGHLLADCPLQQRARAAAVNGPKDELPKAPEGALAELPDGVNKQTLSSDSHSNEEGKKEHVHKRKLVVCVCYNCGEPGHSTFACPIDKASAGCGAVEGHRWSEKCCVIKVGDGMSYAICFVCNEEGHLASRCSKNERGVYPKVWLGTASLSVSFSVANIYDGTRLSCVCQSVISVSIVGCDCAHN